MSEPQTPYLDVEMKIENEGLDYYILDYESADNLQWDPELQRLFTNAETALREFRDYLERKVQEEDEDLPEGDVWLDEDEATVDLGGGMIVPLREVIED